MKTQLVPVRAGSRRVSAVNYAKRKPVVKAGMIWQIAVWALLVALAMYALKEPTRQWVSGEAVDGTTRFTGAMSDGKFSGTGKLELNNGDWYEGEFVAGRFDGRGAFVSADGWSYEGEFSSGQIIGEGMLRTTTGDIQTRAEADDPLLDEPLPDEQE